MQNRSLLVVHEQKLYTFPGDKVKEALDFSVKRMGGIGPESKKTAASILENGEAAWPSSTTQPSLVLHGLTSGPGKTVAIYLCHDGLKAG